MQRRWPLFLAASFLVASFLATFFRPARYDPAADVRQRTRRLHEVAASGPNWIRTGPVPLAETRRELDAMARANPGWTRDALGTYTYVSPWPLWARLPLLRPFHHYRIAQVRTSDGVPYDMDATDPVVTPKGPYATVGFHAWRSDEDPELMNVGHWTVVAPARR